MFPVTHSELKTFGSALRETLYRKSGGQISRKENWLLACVAEALSSVNEDEVNINSLVAYLKTNESIPSSSEVIFSSMTKSAEDILITFVSTYYVSIVEYVKKALDSDSKRTDTYVVPKGTSLITKMLELRLADTILYNQGYETEIIKIMIKKLNSWIDFLCDGNIESVIDLDEAPVEDFVTCKAQMIESVKEYWEIR